MAANTKGRLIIVDPSLRDTRGHHFALTRVIVDSAVISGFQVVVFSNKSAGSLEIPGARVRPVFSKATYDYFIPAGNKKRVPVKERVHQFISLRCPESLKVVLRRGRDRLKKVRGRLGVPINSGRPSEDGGLLIELRDALIEEKVTGVGHVLVHTADGIIYRTILQLMQNKYPLGDFPHFHLCTPYDMRIMPHSANGMPVNRVIGYLNQMGFLNRKIFLYAENELLADSLTNAWGVEVNTLDIPMKRIELAARAKQSNNNVFRVVYLGAAREEKGFPLIPDVIEIVLNKTGAGQKVEFIVQCSPQIVGYTKKIEATIERLKSFPATDVRLIRHQQTEDEYYGVLDSADIVLCCYQKENYRVRGSGIATEAVAYGKVMIVTPGTYPEWLAGDAGLPARDSKEIAEAILTVTSAADYYKNKALERAEWFAEKTRPDEYVNKLLANEQRADIKLGSAGSSAGEGLSGMTGGGYEENAAQIGAQDDTVTENKYNSALDEADVSEDGKVLFVKQVSKQQNSYQ
ncbi:glycosyltransferase [bacterium]|nr:glycosyltransferase [bacterium]